MKEIVAAILNLFIYCSLISASAPLREAREAFFRAGQEPCAAKELIEITGKEPSDYLLLAYQGAAYTILADCVRSPFNKLKYFNKGREILDNAVRMDPSDPEIRFIRFMVQDGAPAFLDYDNRQEDLDVWIDAYEKKKLPNDSIFIQKMAAAISGTDYPDENQLDKIDALK
jgi:hypothetical protein